MHVKHVSVLQIELTCDFLFSFFSMPDSDFNVSEVKGLVGKCCNLTRFTHAVDRVGEKKFQITWREY